MVSVKKNFFYSSFLTTANYLFTFITYPYVSRVLGVDKIGAVNFIDSVINYFIMLSMLGIAIVGIREVAKCRDERERLDNAFSSLIALNLIFTVGAIVALGVAYCFLQELQEHSDLMLLGALKLVANVFLLDWFFKGIENFKIITIRTFAIRLLYVAATFAFIHSADDYAIYYLLLSASIVANALFNCLYLRGRVSFSLRNVRLRPYITPVCILGLYMFFGNFYSSFNTTILGLKCGDTEVGYFSTATKLFAIIIALMNAFTTVMMPRMSRLLHEGKLQEYHSMFGKSVSVLLAFGLPAVLLAEVQADNIIYIISGAGYDGAVVPMMVCMPLLLIIGYNQILLNQGLMPLSKDRAILLSSLCGGILALLMCFVLIPLLKSVGSATLWLLSEIAVCMIAGYYLYKYIGIKFPIKKVMGSLLAYAPLLCLLVLIKPTVPHCFYSLAAASVLTFVYSFVLQYFVLKDETLRSLLGSGARFWKK